MGGLPTDFVKRFARVNIMKAMAVDILALARRALR